jgi:DNA repair exonuclease SbcCD ATPase subunit
MNYSEFSRQCSLKHPKNILAVCRQGQQPTGKLMDKIIKRFPQLNYDWVMLGYGEMIVQGMKKQPANAISVTKSRDASYENIQQFLENHDYSLNELANRVQKAMFQAEKTYQKVSKRLDNFEDRLVSLEEKQKEFNDLIDQRTTNAVRMVLDSMNQFWDRHENKINTDLKGLVAFMTKLKQEMKETSDGNAEKAFKFVTNLLNNKTNKGEDVIGEFKKHTNPKPQK